MNTTVVDRLVPATRGAIGVPGRVPSGVPGLDELVGGGFPFHRTVLLQGDIGTGKTTFGLQFLMEGAKRGEAGVLVSVDEKPQHVLDDARRFGWDVDGAADQQLITVLDASPCFTALRGKHGLDARRVASDLTQQIRRLKASRLVIDGATSLVSDGAPVTGVEDFLRSLIVSLEDNLGCTTVLTTRTSAGGHTSPVGPTAERLTSGVIELMLGPLGGSVGRSLQVRKMRGAPMAFAVRPFDIVDGWGLVLREPTGIAMGVNAEDLSELLTSGASFTNRVGRTVPWMLTAPDVDTLIAEVLPAEPAMKRAARAAVLQELFGLALPPGQRAARPLDLDPRARVAAIEEERPRPDIDDGLVLSSKIMIEVDEKQFLDFLVTIRSRRGIERA